MESGEEFFYDIGERARFRVESEVWHDHTPQRPNLDLDEAQQKAEDLEREVPYTVIVSYDDRTTPAGISSQA